MNDRLETAIDEVGRNTVFDIMRAAGWTGRDAPPRWVWWEAVRIVSQQVTCTR